MVKNVIHLLGRALWLGLIVLGLALLPGAFPARAGAAGPPPMPKYAYVEVTPQVDPPYDVTRYVRLWWDMPMGTREQVTYYILESAFDPEFRIFPSSHVLPASAFGLDEPNVLVGVPEQDGVAYYYRVWACNDHGCSMPRWAGVVARRVWPDPSAWNFYFACSWEPEHGPVPPLLADLIFVCSARSLTTTHVCDMAYYSGVAGYGGVLHSVVPNACIGPAPSGAGWRGWPPPYVSVGERIGPWEVAMAVRLPEL